MNAFVKYIINIPMMAKMIIIGINEIAEAVLVMPNI
jgi:NADH/NAD ratio-sensing transcriptional regulator Rex